MIDGMEWNESLLRILIPTQRLRYAMLYAVKSI
jgi:hypothetical protein